MFSIIFHILCDDLFIGIIKTFVIVITIDSVGISYSSSFLRICFESVFSVSLWSSVNSQFM